MSNGYLKECYICETNKYDALIKEVWNYLEVPASVILSYLPDEDKDRVFVQARVRIDEVETVKKVGTLSKEDSESILKYVAQGWKEVFDVRICKADKKADENKRFSIAIRIVQHPQEGIN